MNPPKYKIKKGYDALYSGAPVWWQARHDSGKMGAGILFGSIWDTDNNGEVIEFSHDSFYARFFITTNVLTKCWDVSRQMFVIDDAKLLGLVDETKHEEQKFNRPYAFCTRNRKSVAIWTYYY